MNVAHFMQAVRLQLPQNASSEVQDEVRRQWYAQQQALLAQANSQGLRQNPGLGRGLLIPGGPNGRQMPIRPNTGTNPIAGAGPMRLPNGASATPEQVQQLIKARQQLALANAPNGANQMRLHQVRQMQQAQLNAAQSAGQTGTNAVGDYIPFVAQANGAAAQCIKSSRTKLISSSISSWKPCSKQSSHAASSGWSGRPDHPPRNTPATTTVTSTRCAGVACNTATSN